MKKIFSKIGIFAILIFSFLLSFFSTNSVNVSAASATEEVKYGTVDIEIDYAFYLRYGVSPYSGFNLGDLGKLGNDRYSAFAFNIPEEVEEKITSLEIVNVKYKECEQFNFNSQYEGNLLPLCLSKSKVYTEDSLDANNNISVYYSKNYLDYIFKGKRSLTPISQIGLVENLVNYKDKSKLDLLVYADDEINDYKYYAVVENDLIYDEIVLSIEFVDDEGEWNIYYCNIDEKTGMCTVPNLDHSDETAIYRLLDMLKKTVAKDPSNIIWIIVLIVVLIILAFFLLPKILSLFLSLLVVLIEKAPDIFKALWHLVVSVISLPFKIIKGIINLFSKNRKNKR